MYSIEQLYISNDYAITVASPIIKIIMTIISIGIVVLFVAIIFRLSIEVAGLIIRGQITLPVKKIKINKETEEKIISTGEKTFDNISDYAKFRFKQIIAALVLLAILVTNSYFNISFLFINILNSMFESLDKNYIEKTTDEFRINNDYYDRNYISKQDAAILNQIYQKQKELHTEGTSITEERKAQYNREVEELINKLENKTIAKELRKQVLINID